MPSFCDFIGMKWKCQIIKYWWYLKIGKILDSLDLETIQILNGQYSYVHCCMLFRYVRYSDPSCSRLGITLLPSQTKQKYLKISNPLSFLSQYFSITLQFLTSRGEQK